MKQNEAEETEFEGVIIPVGWGTSGDVLAVSLVTFDEGEYSIDPGIAWDHFLRDHLRKRVRLSGVLHADGTIQVRRVEVLENPERVP